MRNEWSLECRQVGLDHLAECFAKPAVENPKDSSDEDETMMSSRENGDEANSSNLSLFICFSINPNPNPNHNHFVIKIN